MLNKYYFTGQEQEKEEIFKKDFVKKIANETFYEEISEYLADQYDYTLHALVEDIGLSFEDLSNIYENDIYYKDFVEILIEELHYLQNSRFNVLWGSQRHPHV